MDSNSVLAVGSDDPAVAPTVAPVGFDVGLRAVVLVPKLLGGNAPDHVRNHLSLGRWIRILQPER